MNIQYNCKLQNEADCTFQISKFESSKSSRAHGLVKPLELWSSSSSIHGIPSLGSSSESPSMLIFSSEHGIGSNHGQEELDASLATLLKATYKILRI